MKNITIFCASSSGFDPVYCEQAKVVGKALADRNIGLIYGGAKIGLMGALADSILHHGGKAIGVLPHFLGSKEVAHKHLTQLIMVDTMHERKTKMNELCDGVIALPGGFGTLEELFEMLTWAQLGLHKKPIGLLNTNGFYDTLISLINHMTDCGFLKSVNRNMLLVERDIDTLLEKMHQYTPPDVGKWLNKRDV